MHRCRLELFADVVCVVFSDDWFRETVRYVYLYFLPDISITFGDWLGMIGYPLRSFWHLGDRLSLVLAPLTLLIGGGMLGVLFDRNKRFSLRQKVVFLSIFFAVLLMNNRVSVFPAYFYQGFHLFPFLVGYFSLGSFWLVRNYRYFERRAIFWLLAGWVVIVVGYNFDWALADNDKESEYTINYGEYEAYGRAIKVIKRATSTLMTGPEALGYTNIVGDIPIAGR